MKFIKTGFKEIDEGWGGFILGRSYLQLAESNLYNTKLALIYTHQGLENKEKVLYFSTLPAGEFTDFAAKQGFSLKEYLKNEKLVLQIFSQDLINCWDDIKLSAALRSLKNIMTIEKPDRLIIDTLLPILNFQSPFNLYGEIFELQILLESLGITALFTLPTNFKEEKPKAFLFLKEICAGITVWDGEKWQMESRLAHPILEPESKKTIEVVPLFPESLEDRDEFTGLYNWQGFEKILCSLISQKKKFSLPGFRILNDVAEPMRLIFLHRLAKIIKERNFSYPAMRHTDKIFFLLFNTEEERIELFQKIIKEEEMSGGIKTELFFYQYPKDFESVDEFLRLL